MLYFITSLSHILYFFVWDFTEQYIKLSYYLQTTPIFLLTFLSIFQKLLQFNLIIYYSILNDTIIPYVEDFNIINLLLIITGQVLNMSVYKKLGAKGVYYGNKLGHTLPYITTFPYNLGIKNPQYVGCILTLCGLYPLISIRYLMYSSSLYYITMYIEEH